MTANLAHVLVQNTSTSELINEAVIDSEPTPGLHMENKSLVCFNGYPHSCLLFLCSILHYNKTIDRCMIKYKIVLYSKL